MCPIRPGSGFGALEEFIAMKTHLFSIVLAGLIVLVSHSPAAAVEYNLWIPFVDDFDSCTGERVEVTGTQHIIGRSHEDGAGHLHFSFTRHTQGTGTGSISEADYVLIDSVSRSELDGIAVDGTVVFVERFTALFIRQGEDVPSDDNLANFITRYTITPNGDVTASVEIADVICH